MGGRRRLRWTAMALAVALVAAAVALAAPGDRDPLYGTGGSVLYAQDTVQPQFRDVVAHPLGGVVAAGRTGYTTAGGGLSPLLVTRHTETGAIDQAWGNQSPPAPGSVDRRGSFRMTDGSVTEAHRVALDSQNRVYIAAETVGTEPGSGGGLMIVRLTPAGQIDTSYSGDGKSPVIAVDDDIDITAISVSSNFVVTVSLNHIVTRSVGELFQFLPTGELDTGFSGDGRVTATDAAIPDMLVDGARQVLYVRGNLGGDPDDPSSIHQLRRLTSAGVADTSFSGDGVQQLPAAMNPYPAKIVRHDLGDIYVGTASGASGGVNFRLAKVNTDGTLVADFGGVGNDHGTAFLPGVSGPALRGIALTSDRRPVLAARVNDADGGRIALARFRESGIQDSSFRTSAAGEIRFATVDHLGLPATTTVDPLGGVIHLADDKMLVAGFTDVPSGADHAFLARYGTPGLPPTVSLTRTYQPYGDPPVQHDNARPGVVDFAATASDPEQGPLTYEWSVDGAAFQPGEATFSPYLYAGDHTITVRVRDEDGQDATAAVDAKILANTPPEARIGAAHDSYDPTFIPNELDEDRVVIFKSLGGDDGSIVKVEWDLDGVAGFEKTGLRTFNVFPTVGNKTIRLKVTDNEGVVTQTSAVLKLVNPPCAANRTIEIGRLRATAPCWNKKVEGTLTTWTATDPPPPPPPGQFQLAEPPLTIESGLPAIAYAAASLNGILFFDYDVLQIFQRQGRDPQISFAGARVATASSGGTPFQFQDGGSETWIFDRDAHKIRGVNLPQGSEYGGLRVNDLSEPIYLPEAGKARVRFYPRLPAELGGAAVDEVATITTGIAAGNRSLAAGLECFKANGAVLPGLDFGGNSVTICRDPDDADHWTADVKVKLSDFIAPPFTAPDLSARVDINGESAEIHGAASFGNSGILMLPPVIRLNEVNFDILRNPTASSEAVNGTSYVPPGVPRTSKAKCLPGVGIERRSMQDVRDILLAKGVPRAAVYTTIPDFELNYGVPTLAVCGGIVFSVGVSEMTVATGSVSLGVAQYDDRVDAFRARGRLDVLDGLFGATGDFAVYSDGYSDMRIDIDEIVFYDLVSLDGGVRVQVDVIEKQYQAEAWVKGCVIPVDFCSSIKGMLSSKGIGGCLGLYFLGGRWEPGAVWSYADGATPYLYGCDLSEIEVNFDGEGSTKIYPVFVDPGAANRQSTAFAPKVVGSSLRTMQAEQKHEQEITVRAGLPGVYIAARGENNQLSRFTLTGPKGERISVDGRANGTASEGKDLIVGHDEKQGVSHVLIGSPTPGVWKLTPDAGSVPIVDVWSSEGLAKPKIVAKVRGRGRRRELVYTVATRKGQTVRFEERGATGKQVIGDATGAKGRIRFVSAAGKAEKREIVAIVEQDGLPRGEQVAGSYRAPGSGVPTRVGRAIVKRSGSRVTVSWLPAANAERYLITGELSDGRVINKQMRGRRLVLRKVARTTTGEFAVVGVNELGRSGKPTKRKLARPKARKKGR